MPRINRIRVTNIQYDNNKKQLPDITFELMGLDSVLLLANGGGKSLLAQLMLQTVLPNERMGQRRIADLIESQKHTGHVAVEWLLDSAGERRQFLCTGFCYGSGSGSDKDLKYFNYLFNYDDRSDITCISLPLVQDGEEGEKPGPRRPIAYQALKDWLRDKGIQLFENNLAGYHNAIRTFQILPEEWKSIRNTNSTEGGVDKFFEKSRTTQQLVDNLLIPSVEEIIFQKENQKRELYSAFNEHRGMLLDIPVIKQNIQDFEVIIQQSEGVVGEGEKLYHLQGEFADITGEIFRLARTFHDFAQEAKKAASEMETQKHEKTQKLKQLDWQKDSYKVFLKQIEYDKALKLEVQAEAAFNVQRAVNEEVRQKHDRLKALCHFNDALEAEEEEKRHQAALRLLDRNEPELLQQLNGKKRFLKSAWSAEEGRLRELKREYLEELERLEKEFANLDTRLNNARSDENQLRAQLTRLQVWFEEYIEHREALLKSVSEAEILKPEEGLEGRHKLLNRLKEQETETKSLKEKLARQQVRLNGEIIGLIQTKAEEEREFKNLSDKLGAYRVDEESIRGLLSESGRFVRSLLDVKDDTLLWIRDILWEARERRVEAQAGLANLQEKWAILENRDYYVPNHELLKIKSRLERAGVSAVLGSEWLAAQQLSGKEKEGILKRLPLLPFAILIEGNQLNAVRIALGQVKEWSCDLPFLFLVRSGENLRTRETADSFLHLWQDELFLYQPKSLEVYTSPEAFQALKNRLAGDIRDMYGVISSLNDRESSLSGLKERVEGFYRHYSRNLVDGWLKEQEQQQDKVAELVRQIDQGEAQIIVAGEEIDLAEETLERLSAEQEAVSKIITALAEFCKLHGVYADKQEKEGQVNLQLAEIQSRLSGWDETKNKNIRAQGDKKREIDENETAITSHDRDKRFFQLNEVEAAPEVTALYNDLKLEVESILTQLKGRQSERENIEQLIESAGKRKQMALGQVDETGVALDWMRNNRRQVSKVEIDEAAKEKKKQEASLGLCEKAHRDAQTKTGKEETLLKEYIHNVREGHEKEPYLEFSYVDYELELKLITETIKELNQAIESLDNEIKGRYEWERDNQEAFNLLSERLPGEFRQQWDKIIPLAMREWEAFGLRPGKLVRQKESERDNKLREVERQKEALKRKFEVYFARLRETNNVKVRQFIRDVQAIMDDERLYDYNFLQTQFIRIYEGLGRYKAQYELSLQECEHNKTHLVNLSLRRARTVYESILEIPRNSRVKIYGRDLQVIRIDWRVRDEDEIREKMSQYFEQLLGDMQGWKAQGIDDDAIDRRLEDLLKTRSLIQVIAPVEDCRVTVYKPRQEAVARLERIEYSRWDEVSKWSGGEEYSIYITMFMIMISHIRQQCEGRLDVWKVILADNPFGKASSPHILETIFQVARSNRIQFICLTAHKQEEILKRFPVVYSMQLRSFYGKEVMQAERLETGFYRLDSARGDSSQMMLTMN